MISTMLQIREAAEEALMDPQLMELAGFIFQNHKFIDDEQLAQLLFKYSSSLTSLTATLVTQVCLSHTDLSDMIATIKEMNELSKEME